MTVTNYYKVAGHTFGVSGEAGVFALMDNYVPFVNHGDRSMIAAKLHITRPVPVILPSSQHSEQHPACNNKRGTLDGVSRFCYLRIPNRWKLFGGT